MLPKTIPFAGLLQALSPAIRRSGFLCLGVVLAVFSWNPAGLSGQDTGLTVRGSVTDTITGRPVSGALLRLDTGQDV
jgi:hypothetical protein